MKNVLLYVPILLCLMVSYANADMQFYLDAPYIIAPLGEGKESTYAPEPIFREDGFDCTTYVETILAQYKQKKNSTDFIENILKIRYVDGEVDYFTRAHLVEYQWIPNALHAGFIAEYSLKNTLKTQFSFDLQQWFLQNSFVQNKDKEYINKALQQPKKATASIAYVPKEYINAKFIATLPNFMVVFFLREISDNLWPGQKGAQRLVTHMGLLKEGKLYHASREYKKVVHVDFLKYLRERPNFVGVSFYTIK